MRLAPLALNMNVIGAGVICLSLRTIWTLGTITKEPWSSLGAVYEGCNIFHEVLCTRGTCQGEPMEKSYLILRKIKYFPCFT